MRDKLLQSLEEETVVEARIVETLNIERFELELNGGRRILVVPVAVLGITGKVESLELVVAERP